MALLVTNNRNAAAYLQLGNFQLTTRTRQIFMDGVLGGHGATYIDKFDRVLSHVQSVEDGGERPCQWDPNLIDSSSGSVSIFNSPINDGTNTPWFVSAYDPSTTNQRLFHVNSSNPFQELPIADPTVILDSNPFPKFDRGQSIDFDFGAGDQFAWNGPSGTSSVFLFLPDIDLAIAMNMRVYVGATPVLKHNVITAVTISTGAGVPLGVPGIYDDTADEFGRPAVFDETTVLFLNVQFAADNESTADKPKGELFFSSKATAPVTPNDGRVYVKLVDFNPSGVAGTPNRIHLRETLFSRINLTLNTAPTGDPPSPLNGLPDAVSALQEPNVWLTSEGGRRMNVMNSDGTAGGQGNSYIVQASQAVVASIITPPAPKQDPLTNRTVSYRCEVLGDLGELVANAVVDWTMERLSTVTETLVTTPTPGETVVVDNFPIDRSIEFAPGFAVLEDGVPLTETTHFTVTEASGQIHFVSPKPLGAGEVYTIRYAHTAAGATPAHGTIVDAQVFSNVNGIAETRVTWPDDDLLVDHIDQIQAVTP